MKLFEVSSFDWETVQFIIHTQTVIHDTTYYFINLLFPVYNLLTANTDTDFRSICSLTVLTRIHINAGVHTA